MSPSKRWDSRDVLSNFSLKDSTIAQICDLFIVPSLETILRHIVTSLSIPYETFCIWLYYGVLWFCMLGRAPSTFWPILAPMNLKKVWKTIGKQRKNMKQSQPCDDHPRELQLRIPHFLGKASSQTAWRAGWNENRSAVVQNYGHVTGIVEATWLYIYIYIDIFFSHLLSFSLPTFVWACITELARETLGNKFFMTLGTSKHRTILTLFFHICTRHRSTCYLFAAKEGLPRARIVPPAKRGDAIDRNWHYGVHPFTGQAIIEKMDQNGDKCWYFSFFLKYVEFESWTYRCSEFHPMPRTWMSNWPTSVWMIQMLGAGKRCLWVALLEVHVKCRLWVFTMHALPFWDKNRSVLI